MITMDLKGISWVGDMYDRFESMCVEVDEIVCQDTVKFVENQMRTVGASVKKFYSEVMEDLLPPSSLDQVNEENPSIAEKTKLENEGDPVNYIAEQRTKDFDNNANHRTCSAVCSLNMPYEPTLHNSAGNQCAEKDLSNLQTYSPIDLDNGQDSEQKSPDIASVNNDVIKDPGEELTCSEVFTEIDELLCENRNIRLKSTSVLEVNLSKADVMAISEEIIGGDGSVDAVEESRTTMSSSRDMSANIDETSNPSVAREIENGDADNQGELVSEQFDKMKLGESCVLVEKSEHSFKLPVADERKSYKKKIRDVFSPKRWSKGKQDQEQLAMWYEEQTGNKLFPTALKHAGIPDSQQLKSLELEWELL